MDLTNSVGLGSLRDAQASRDSRMQQPVTRRSSGIPERFVLVLVTRTDIADHVSLLLQTLQCLPYMVKMLSRTTGLGISQLPSSQKQMTQGMDGTSLTGKQCKSVWLR